MVKRQIEEQIRNDFGKGKAIVVLGPRQVGKTTLLNQLTAGMSGVLAFNCDNSDDRAELAKGNATALKALVGKASVVTIDEAQRLPDVGLTVKMLVDAVGRETQIIVTGSSALELSSGIAESAAGRFFGYRLFPFSRQELVDATNARDEGRLLESRLVYGSYPEVATNSDDARRILDGIVAGALYKDILSLGGVRKPEPLQRLVQCLALQVGSEVSYSELGGMAGIDKSTVETYIDLLEKTFVVFRLPSLSRNARNEIRKGRKVYFWDNGIRNAVIGSFAPLALRTDVGSLWENYFVAERSKRNIYLRHPARGYFWRTTTQSEIDYVEETDGRLAAFEVKWNPKRRAKLPAAFAAAYPGATFEVVTRENYDAFVGG